VLTDRPDEYPESYALAPSGNSRVSTDITGCRTYQNNYVFYAKAAAADEVDRQDNHAFLESLTDWLEVQDRTGNYPVLPDGCSPEKLTVSNALLFDMLEDGTGIYQVQIQFTYTKRSETAWLT
jgi:hypothetical protein